MSPARFRECLDALRWSQRGMAGHLGTHPTTVRRWASGACAIPDNVARWLERLADAHLAHAMPEGWRDRAA